MRAFLIIAITVALAGCAAQTAKNLVRKDDAPVDAAREQATLAQCKGEGATTVMQSGGGVLEPLERTRKENTVIVACMARNGYILPQ